MSYVGKMLNIGIIIVGEFTASNKHHSLQCINCKHVWKATPKAKMQSHKIYGGNGCPACHNEKVKIFLEGKRAEFYQKIRDKGFEVLSEYNGNQQTIDKITVKNLACNHIFDVWPGNLIHREVTCPICNTQRKKNYFKQVNKKRQAIYFEMATEWEKYKSAVHQISRLNYIKYKTSINPYNYPRGKAGQEGKYQLDHMVAMRYCFDNNIPPEICAHPQNLQMLLWTENLSFKAKLKDEIPPIFYRYMPDEVNTNISNFVQTIKELFPSSEEFAVVGNTMVTIKVDNIVLQYCNFNSYIESKTQNTRHNVQMLQDVKKEQCRMIQVYEDEWFYNRELVLSKITHLLGKSNLPLIHARKCIIKQIDSKSKSKFLFTNHIQGNDDSKINLGAYYNNELISVMTFCTPRVALGGNNITGDGIYELSRFATDITKRIPGIASKILSYFEKNFPCNMIYSFADRRWSDGNLYVTLGFDLEKINPPSYAYLKDGMRKHRWNYRKDKIKKWEGYDPNLTEYQNMQNFGYDRVWDCGTLKFVKLINTPI